MSPPLSPFTFLKLTITLPNNQAEFSYKLKPKLPAQFKAAESTGIPLAVILGEDELAAGKVRVKQMGLEPGHPEKDGVLVDLTFLATEVKTRLDTIEKDGGKVAELAEKVDGLKTEDAGV